MKLHEGNENKTNNMVSMWWTAACCVHLKKSGNLHSDALLVFLKVIKISKEQTIYNIWYNSRSKKGAGYNQTARRPRQGREICNRTMWNICVSLFFRIE